MKRSCLLPLYVFVLLGLPLTACPSSPTADDLATPPPVSDLTAAADLVLVPPADLGSQPAPDGGVVYLPGVTVGTLAGAGVAGSDDGTGAAARFQNPGGLAIEPSGSLIVNDIDGARVRRVTADGVVTTLAAAAGFVGPFGAAVDAGGKILVGTDFNKSGKKDAMSGTVWTVTPMPGMVVAPQPLAEGLGRPRGLCALPGGKFAVADRLRHTISLLDPAKGTVTPLAGAAGMAGFQDAQGTDARFDNPYACAPLPDGSLVVADANNHRVRRLTLDGAVTTYAGDGVADSQDGPRLSARFATPQAVASDSAGNVYVSDTMAYRVRRIEPGGQVRTLAGDGTRGFQDGQADLAQFYGLEGIAARPDGKRVYVTDGNQGDGSAHNRVRVITIP